MGVKDMCEWLHLERLEDNDLPLPNYATEGSAGFDLAACLTRPIKQRGPNGWESLYCDSVGARTPGKPDLDAATSHIRAATMRPQLFLRPQEIVLVPLGWKCEFNPHNVLQFHVRSSVGTRGIMLANGTAIIDSDYRGELMVALYNFTDSAISVCDGERIAQAILLPMARPVIKEGIVGSTDRGEGGVGSTGRMEKQRVKT